MGRAGYLRSRRAPPFLFTYFRSERESMVSAIPTQYPVTLTDGEREYPVFTASEYVNAVYKLGHNLAADRELLPEAVAEPVVTDE
ncbi:hypothetical protein C8259_32110 [Nocardia nova]|uniref:Uncharacterized protein n=2 Tax=Nocardia TaxID=1817 RepID=A0A2T2YRB1_9NOCA|nr:hypothetical protein C8259_32110 [Nocardia nova]